MELSTILKEHLKKGGFTIETLAQGFCDEIGKKIKPNTFLAIFENLENQTTIALCEACGCGEMGGGFDVLEEFKPMNILDTKTRQMVKLSSFAGFGPKKIEKIILDGLGATLAEQRAKYYHDVIFVMGEQQCKTCSFVIFQFDQKNSETLKPIAQISIVESMQNSEDIKELFA